MGATTEPKPYHHGDLRSAALDAGRRLLGERSEAGLSLREIAREVGVSAPAVYRHFPDKAALMQALAAEGLEQLARAQATASAAAGGGLEGFLATGMAYVEFALDNPALFRLIFSHPPSHFPMDRGLGAVSTAMTLLLEASSKVAPPAVDAMAFALRAWGLAHGLAMLALDGQIPADRARIRAALNAFA